jgi:hypothetical protein
MYTIMNLFGMLWRYEYVMIFPNISTWLWSPIIIITTQLCDFIIHSLLVGKFKYLLPKCHTWITFHSSEMLSPFTIPEIYSLDHHFTSHILVWKRIYDLVFTVTSVQTGGWWVVSSRLVGVFKVDECVKLEIKELLLIFSIYYIMVDWYSIHY